MPQAVTISERAQEHLDMTVAALRRSATYPGDEAPEEAIETHLAWVFLTGTHAYKLMKPIRARLIDYTTSEARREACYTELELNRRLAAPVYRAVVPLAETDGELQLDGDGTAVDWLVKMKRLPRDQMLDACIEHGTVARRLIDRLGAKLSTFYVDAERVRWTGVEYRRRLTAHRDSMHDSLTHPRYGLDPAALQPAVARQNEWLAEHASLLERRADRVVEGHGDLRPEHVCLLDEPMVIDCLEFSRSLRLIDPVSELSFLSLECRRLGAEWIGEELLSLYRQRTGDDASPTLVPFYESYHALVRAAITIWHLDDETVDRPEVWRHRAEEYLRAARERL